MSNIPPPVQPQQPYEPYNNPPKKSNMLLIVGAIFAVGFCVIIPIFAAILFPVFAQARVAAVRTQALSDIKLSATSMLLYQADHDDHFPPNMKDTDVLKEAIFPYINDYKDHWTIYGTPTHGNPNLSGTNANELKTPNLTIMLYCQPAKLQGTAVVAAADSSAHKVKGSDLDLEISSNSYKIPLRK